MSEFIMEYLPVEGHYIKAIVAFFILIARYFLIAGLAFLVFYKLRSPSKKFYRRIQSKFAKAADYKREITYSITTFAIFACMVFIVKHPALDEYTKLYRHIDDYGLSYFFFSIVLMIVIHDTYFYWTHRLMHHPKIYPVFHKVHHLSKNPSPWASFSFHPLEAIVEFGILPIFIFSFPVHPVALLSFSMFMTLENVMGHLGYEIFPKGWNNNFITKWINTSTNHNMHHQYFRGNYGLYFTWWDRLMGTMHPDYERRFEEVTGMEIPSSTIADSTNEVVRTTHIVHGG